MCFDVLLAVRFQKAVWLLPACWFLHEMEEWNILNWYHEYWVNVPDVTAADMRVGLVLMSLAGLGWTVFTVLFKNPKVTALLVLPFFTVVAFSNALQHIYWVFAFAAYSPGVVTSVLLVIPVILYLTIRATQDQLIPIWYAALIYVPVVRSVYGAVQAGNVVPEPIHGLTRIFAAIARLIGV